MSSIISNSKPLDFIGDDVLFGLCKNLIDKAQTAADKAETDIYKNVIDPFSATFDSLRQGVPLDIWLEQEKSRQIQKTLQNYVGEFHQAVLGSVEGWEDLKVGGSIDLRNREKKIIAEVKNKHNTMNSNSQTAIYDRLQRHLDYDESYRGFTAYCVVIIPKSTQSKNVPFHPSERGTQKPKRENIRIIDGRSFYEIVTGDPEAIQKLYYRIPIVLDELIGQNAKDLTSSYIFNDLFKKAYISKK